jgi:hypothetical protein
MSTHIDNNVEYKILHLDELNGKNYVEIALDKQRKHQFSESSIFLEKDCFKLVGEIIWVKYREYRPNKIIKIQSSEWLRIVDEINKEVSKLEVDAGNSKVVTFLNNLSVWIKESVANEDYLTICDK